MPRYLIHLAYDGTRYYGWQIQPDVRTVQGNVEQAIRTLTREEVCLYGSGRTDTGVHAENQYAHFDTLNPVETDRLVFRLRRMLPDDICILDMYEVPANFHARFDALWRQYRYQLLPRPDPFQRLYAWYPGEKPDWKTMCDSLDLLKGEHDFAGFSRKMENQPHTRCTILDTAMETDEKGMVMIRIRANRFLRSMIRALVGGIVCVGMEKKSLKWFRNHLEEGAEIDNMAIAPSKGLFLEHVFYPKSSLDLTSSRNILDT